MGFKSIFFFIFCSFTILQLQQHVEGFPQTSESEEYTDDIQQIQQQGDENLNEYQKNINNNNNKNGIHTNTNSSIIKLIDPINPLDYNDTCLQKHETGPCKGYFHRYFLNQIDGKCERFIYGGCGGTSNNFKTFNECETKCSRHLKSITSMNLNNIIDNSICELPPVNESIGMSCLAMIPRWTYDVEQEKCIRYMYGGCFATQNNFINKYDCQKTCGNYIKKSIGIGIVSSSSGEEIIKSNLKKSICEQQMETGPCYGMMKRYFFSKQKNRCEKFIYGGCGGNDNNFATSDECLRSCGGDIPSDDEACSLIECPWNLYSHYQTLGCKPIYDGQSCCPTRYDCPDVNNTIGKTWVAPTCSYKGKFYGVGESVIEANIESSCRAACTCYGFGGKPRINCASIECPENLGALPEEKKNCIRLYKRDTCCAHDFYCPNDTMIDESPTKEGRELQAHIIPIVLPETCNYAGKEYVIGERFYPKNGQCIVCTCLKGFNGTLSNEFCRNIDCGIEIYYSSQLERGCAPVYLRDSDGQDSCCPIGWQCPDEKIPTMRSQRQGSSSLSHTRATGQVLYEQKYRIKSESITINITSTVCHLPSVTGPCRSIRPRFFFNNITMKCESFIYGGCHGNENNFILQSDCIKVCENNTEITTQPPAPIKTSSLARSRSTFIQPQTFQLTEVDPCVLPVKTGVCRGYFPRYFFSPQDNVCKYFVYGGCNGNQNNFISMDSCEANCQNKIPTESLRLTQISSSSTGKNRSRGSTLIFDGDDIDDSKSNEITNRSFKPHTHVIDITKKNNNDDDDDDDDDNDVSTSQELDPTVVCNLKPVTGPCRGHQQRYYYDPEVQYCKRFTYGGCRGNANNFEKLKECDYRCAPNKGVGLPGPVSYPKWRSSPTTIIPNVVQVEEQEEDMHIMPIVIDQETEICKLPVKTGVCYGKIPSIYYDTMTNTCQNFTYGGCFGNANRFDSLIECEKTCKIPIVARSGGIHQQWGNQINNNIEMTIMPHPEDRSTSHALSNQNIASGVNDPKDICSQDVSPGICKGRHLRYFWNKESSHCLPFFYSGCRGNKNNFWSESDCISTCGSDPTIERVTNQGVLTCSFGNETLPLGTTLGGYDVSETNNNNNNNNNTKIICGVPVCQCLTPPSLTCIQTVCPIIEETSTIQQQQSGEREQMDLKNICPTPNCGPYCKPTIREEDGCPTCDCETRQNQWDVELVTYPSPEYSLKRVSKN